MRLRFRIRAGSANLSRPQPDRTIDIEPVAGELRIGRRAGVEIQLPFGTVSGLHARIFQHAGAWAVVDLQSANGTFVGGVRLAPATPHGLRPGDDLRLADVSLVFDGEVDATADPPVRSESTATLARRLVNDLFQSVATAEVARLFVESGPSTGESLALTVPDRAYRVGRAPSCDLVLADDDVSREHAVFERHWQGVFVSDLGSKNGLEVDGKWLREKQRLRDGALIVIGSSRLRVDDPEDRYLQQMEAEARAADLRITLPPPEAVDAKPVPAAAPPSPTPTPVETDIEPDRVVRSSRLVPLLASVFALAVLGGVGYVIWVLLWGMGTGGKP